MRFLQKLAHTLKTTKPFTDTNRVKIEVPESRTWIRLHYQHEHKLIIFEFDLKEISDLHALFDKIIADYHIGRTTQTTPRDLAFVEIQDTHILSDEESAYYDK